MLRLASAGCALALAAGLVLLLCSPAHVAAVPAAGAVPGADYPPAAGAVQGRATFTDILMSVFGYFKTGIEALLGREGATNALVGAHRVKYTNYQLLRAQARTEAQVTELMELGQDMDGDVKFWTQSRRNVPLDMLVAPDSVEEVKAFLKKRGIKYEVVFQDLQQMISMQNPKMTKDQRDILRSQVGHSMTFKRYHRYSDMLKYIEHLSIAHPQLVQIINIGKSSEGLPLKVVKVSTGHGKDEEPKQKPGFWIDGGTHAREWISPAASLYILKQLVENFKVNRKIVEGIDWYVMPMVNPDGYEYSHTTDRLWRKTRSKSSDAADEDDSAASGEASGRSATRRSRRRGARVFWEQCEGVDINRNWDFHWGGRGASDDPCDETYSGSKPFSEPETRAIADFLMNNRDKFKVFISLHSYAQMWLLPWGFTKTAPDDYNDLMEMGRTAVDAIAKVGGTKYDIGGATSLLYHSSGGADDWAKGVAGIKYSYTVELRDTGNYGFLLPASQIISTGKEIFAGVKAMAKSLLNTSN
ncbi:carboxypeptidase B-like [Hetaerina americana]|uniref:carboxypeptidase B-like n=1 Tax=Hetaerina americana TaxID=62018 RepID=UPI003A7F5606